MATFDTTGLSAQAKAQASAITGALQGVAPVRDVAAINAQRAQNVANGASAYSSPVGGAIVENGGQVGGAIGASGNLIGSVPSSMRGVDFSVKQSNVFPSTSLAGGKTAQDLLNRRSELEQAAVNANIPSQTERDLTEQLGQAKQLSRKAQLALSRETERLQTATGVSQEISNNFVSDTARRYARTIADLGVGASGIADALQAEVAKRTSAVSAAEGLLKADKDTLSLIQDLQKSTNPTIIGSPQVNQVTGEVTIFKQDPQTGVITSQLAGNVGPSKSFVSTNFSTETGPDGKKVNVLYGVNQDGTVTKQVLGTAGASGVGGSTDDERALLSQFNGQQIVKDYNQVVAQKLATDNVIKNGVGGPADLFLIFSFMKGLDPNSVVRETEYDNAAKSGNIFSGAFAKFNGYFKEKGGKLPESVRSEFQNLINQSVAAKQVQYDNVRNAYRTIAERQGLNPENVTLDLQAALKSQEQPTAQVTETEFTTKSGKTFKIKSATETVAPAATTTQATKPKSQPVNPLAGLGQNYGGFNLTGLFR